MSVLIIISIRIVFHSHGDDQSGDLDAVNLLASDCCGLDPGNHLALELGGFLV
ncbi:unnamed protein product [Amoebophrya sp. A25]|nr:unnamed protein product [Amoebophrya sp. A25]|eukprot:GSA25T00014046001.1